MPFELLTKEDLLIAAIATKRPVAFLVGAPLSLKDGVGVPGVTEILDFVREEIRGRAAFSLPNFETALSGKTGGDAYQEAMKWLGSKMGQDAINDVIKTAVLGARKTGLGEPPEGKDGEPDDWHIPAGTAGLAELAARGGEKFLGPILTTNFDPLVSLAIRGAGGHAVRQVLTGDVTLVGAAADNPGICPIVHLHGFWRDSDTLHTQAQLTNSRPKLAKSLQRLLQRRTLIVAAYGGWEDFFTKALVEHVKTSSDGGVSYQTHSKIAHAGPRLQRALPPQFTEQRRKEIAVAVAQASVAAEDDRLSCIVDLGKTYRKADDFAAAVQVFRNNVNGLSAKVDFDSVVRGYLYEWGVAEGSAGNASTHRAADAWLQGLSIADHLKSAPLVNQRGEPEQLKISCAGLGVAFGKLAQPRPDCPFARGRRASAFLGRLATPDPKTLGYFSRYDRDADKIHTPHPKSIEEAIGWLTTAVVQAGRELQDPFLKTLLKPEHVSFNMLRKFFVPAPSPRSRPKQYAPPPAPQTRPVADAKPVQLRSDFEDRISAGIERVLKQAWEAVPGDAVGEDRFSTAKRKAGDIIPRLSPHIRRQVASYFHAKNWEPLKSRDPKT